MKRRIVLFLLIFSMFFSSIKIEAMTSEKIVLSKMELQDCIREKVSSMSEHFSVIYRSDDYKEVLSSIDSLYIKRTFLDKDNTNIEEDFDFGYYNLNKYHIAATYKEDYVKLDFNFSYRSSKEQVEELKKSTKKYLENVRYKELSEIELLVLIHNYVIDKLDYDYSHTNYDAYNGYIGNKTVCQGYASLFYLMCCQSGIPCRIVASKSHGWNIVKVEDKWYNVDTTWDDTFRNKRGESYKYTFFLKGSKSFDRNLKHKRIEFYNNDSFLREYNINEEDY